MFLIRKARESLNSFPRVRAAARVLAKPFGHDEKRENPERQYCSLLPQFVPEPAFVKVGANDGVTGDPLSDILLADQRWKGLLIEPVPSCFKRLALTFGDSRRFSLEQVAIGAGSGTAAFFYVDERAKNEIPDLPTWYDQLGSFDRNHILKHLNGALEPFIVERPIPMRTLAEVLEKNGMGEVHLLHIDTEGYDFEVLKTVDLTFKPPMAILIEYKHLAPDNKSKMLRTLRAHNYLVDDRGGDYFAIHKKSPLRRLSRDMAVVR